MTGGHRDELAPGPDRGSSAAGLDGNERHVTRPGNASAAAAKIDFGHRVDQGKGVAVELENNNIDTIKGGLRWA